MLEGAEPYLRELGFPEDFGKDPARAAAAVLAMLNIEGVELPENPTPEDYQRLSEQLFGMLGSDLVERLREDDRIKHSTTKSADRPFKVAAGMATGKEKKGLGNTLRDTGRMTYFVNHAGEIDFVQVDQAQEAIIKAPKPMHRLAELGLTGRCFSISSLADAVNKVLTLTGKM